MEATMSSKDTDIQRDGRRDRLIQERIHDPYKPRGQLSEPSLCTQCGVVYTQGRWQWLAEKPIDAEKVLCPACRRIQDRVPAGFLTLGGEFLAKHREEIMHLLHNKVEQQKTQHPMKRLMAIEDQENGEVVVTFTDVHLPRGVGQAIESAYEGELDIKYTDEAGIVRVTWRR
jgi:NMD protein affecting ribosome stability and mRNA decay